MYYYCLIFLLSVLTFLYNLPIRQRKLYTSFLFCCYCISILFVTCFRYDVGSDYLNYCRIYDELSLTEPLYYGLMCLFHVLGADSSLFIACVFLVAFGLKYTVFQRMSFPKGLPLALLFYTSFYYIAYDINGIRQGMALAFTLWAGYCAYMKKRNQFYIWVAVASCIHYTALIFFPFYYICNQMQLNRKRYIQLSVFCVAVSLLGIVDYIIMWNESLFGGSLFAAKLTGYYRNEEFATNALVSFGTLRRIFLGGMILFLANRFPTTYPMKQFIIRTTFFALFIYVLFSQIQYFSTRFSAYYRIYECIAFSYIPYSFIKKNNQRIILGMFVVYACLQVASALSLENHGLLPIQFVFFQ